MPPIVTLLGGGQKPEAILDEVFTGIQHTILSKYPVRFECNCSREQTMALLASLGRDEIEEILNNEGQAIINCQFCHEEYTFDRDDLETILAAMAE